ncbi:MAG: MBL fold metallo-hydrolase [Candidatus Micrarchaeales archaeon]
MDINNFLFWIGHASFYIKHNDKIIFIDPFNISNSIREKADLILITHAHSDHFSKDDIKKVMKPEAEIICSNGCFKDSDFKNFRVIEPGFETDYHGLKINAIPAYNTKKERLMFHPKSNKWVGYIVDVDGFKIYHAGDTDFIEEMKSLNGLGASLLPIGGTYVMEVEEAIQAASAINAKYAVPMHYKQLLGKEGSAAAEEKWRKNLKNALIMKEVQEPKFSF